MATKIFVNLPVTDLARARGFFTALGFAFDPRFSDDTAAGMVVSDDTFVMLLTTAKFQEFTPRPVADATRSTEVLVCLTRERREDVDDLVRRAIAAGGALHAPPKDYGFMHQHGFQDLDGHIWEVIHLDPKAASGAPESPPPRAGSKR